MANEEDNKKSLFNIVFVSIDLISEFDSIETRNTMVARYCTESEIREEIDILNSAYKEYLPLGSDKSDFEAYKKDIENRIKNEEQGRYSLRVLDEKDPLFKIELPYGLEDGKYFTYQKVEYLERGKFGSVFFQSLVSEDIDLEKYKQEMQKSK